MTDLPNNLDDRIQQLEAIEAIRKLKARYFRFIDTKQLDKWKDLFTEDVYIKWETAGAPDAIFHSRDEAVGAIKSLMERTNYGNRTIHHGHMGEIEITTPTTATGIWPMFDYVMTPKSTMQGYGHYHEDYEKQNGTWRIKRLHLTRLHCDYTPVKTELFDT